MNLGNTDEYTIKDFATVIHKTIQSNSTIMHMPATTDDPRQRKPDITVAKARIGWQPKVSVHDGIRNTIEYFRKVCVLNCLCLLTCALPC